MLDYAKGKRTTAERDAAAGNPGQAYREALDGWTALRPHLADGDCRELADQLLSDLEVYGEKLGPGGHPIVGKPLKIK